MSDLISRQAVLDVVKKWFDKMQLNGDICLDGIVSLPSVENKGEWIPDHTVFTKCSCCGWYMRTECFKPYRPKSYHFCPNCGADMRGDKE